MRKYAQIYKQKVVFLTETTLTLDEVRGNFGDEAIWLDVTGLADVGIGYIQGLDADGKFTLIPPTVDDMNSVTEKERRAKILLILMTNLKAKYNKLAMENGFVSIDDALLATVINDAMDTDSNIASSLGEKYYNQRALVRNYFSTEHYQYYKGDYQFFRLADIDKLLEDAKPATVEKVVYPDPVPGTPSVAEPPSDIKPTDKVDDIPELPPLPKEDHNMIIPTVPTNEDNTGDIPELPPLPSDGTTTTNPSDDIPELPPLPGASTETHTSEPSNSTDTLPTIPTDNGSDTVIKPPADSDDDIPALPPTGDDELPPLPGESTGTHTVETSEPTVKIPTTMPDGSPLPATAKVDPKTGVITVDGDDFVTEYYPDGRTSVSAKDHL